MIRYILLFFCLSVTTTIQAQTFTDVTNVAPGLPALRSSSVAWGDYDNDGDLDILIAGNSATSSPGTPSSAIYRNKGDGTFENSGISLPGVADAYVAWGDYDNDGDLDILLTGSNLTYIYRNNGVTFLDSGINLPGITNGAVAWGDYDNDGDLDILMTGLFGSTRISRIYRNDGSGVFVNSGVALPGVMYSSSAWGDYDNDGDLDILITGHDGTGPICKIYGNQGNGTFVENTATPLEGVYTSSAAWGDYDNDGYLDFIVSGYDNSFGITIKLYHNNGNGTFGDIAHSLPGVISGSIIWGDYDNDGDLDILITGQTITAANISEIHRNRGDGTFESSGISLNGGYTASTAWGDYDNDSDLDIITTGYNGNNFTNIFRNEATTANTVPTAPTTLTATPGGDPQSMVLSWAAATDAQTPPAGLSYNVYLSTVAGQANIQPAMSAIPSGFRRVVRIGNNGSLNTVTFKDLQTNVPYYWSVQAIDAAHAGSPFATEATFSIIVQQPQTITISDFAATYGDADFTPAGSASSSLPLSFSSDNASVATVVAGKIHVVGPGTANITASQAGNASYSAATDVIVTLTVSKKTLTVTAAVKFITYGDPLPTLTYAVTGFVGADDESVFTTPVSITTDAIASSDAGDYNITPAGAAAANYDFTYQPAILTIQPAPANITFNALPAKVYGDADFDPGASVSNGLPITYTSSDPLVATIENGNIHITGVGTVTITASQAGNNNYDPATDVDQTLTITKKMLTFTADNKTIDYGQALPILTYSVTGFAPGESEFALLTPVSITTDATGDIGVYNITVGGATADNYDFTYVPATLTIQKATINISFTPLPVKTYGDASFAPGATISNGLPITYSSDNSSVATIVGGNIQINGAGTATITAHQVGDGNYNPSPDAPVTFTVNKKQLTVTAEDKTINYGDPLPTFTYTITGFISGETEAVLTTPVSVSATGTNAGTYPITASGAAAANYDFTYQSGTLTIGKATANISFSSLPVKTYGDADFAPGATISNGLPITYSSSDANVATIVGGNIHIVGAGTTTITAHQAGDGNYNAATDVPVTLTVNKKQLTITADNKTISFGDPLPTFTYIITGFINPDTEASFTTPVSVSSSGTNVGTYPITVSNGAAANYTFNYVAGTLTIGKATANITFPALPVKTYGDADFAPGATISSGLPITYTSDNSSVATIVGSNIHITGAGTATITAHQAGNTNYNAATDVPVTFTVNKKQLTVTAENKTISYGDALPALTYIITGFVPGETASVLTTPVAITTDATTAVGVYNITASGAAAANYDFAYQPGTLTIGKATVQISFSSLPAKTYGDADFAPGATISSGLPITYTSSNNNVATIVGSNIHITGAGTTTITAQQTGNNNYNAATDVPVTLTVNKKQLTVTADNKTINFGDPLPAFTYIVTGFINPDTEATFTTPVSISATGTNVGTYPITPSNAAADNYTFNYVNGTLTIGKATAQISFTTLPVKTYGDADFNPGATISSGLPITYVSSNTNVATIVNGNVHITGAGTATITAQQAGNSNYNPATDVTVTLTVNKKLLIIKADNKTKAYGEPNPPLTYTATGLVNPDTEASFTTPVTLTTDAGTAVGVYNITASGAAAANYDFTYQPGTLTIQKATANIIFNAHQKTYGDADFAPGATISSGLPITYTSSNSSVATITGGNIHIVGAGTSTITASQAGDNNYNAATDVSVILTVNKKQLTVTADDKTKVYGDPNPVFTYTITGFVFGETEAVFTTPVSITATGTTGGTHPITPSNAAAANYSFNYVNGTLTIQKAAQTITFPVLPAKTYGNADFAPGATATSGLAVTYTSSDPNVATIVNGNIHITGAGTVTITATQAGDGNYNAAAPIAQPLVVAKATQTIQFGSMMTRTAGEPAFDPGATASSGLPITYIIENTTIATLSGNLVSPILAGFTKVTATQPGNNNYEPAAPVEQQLEVTGIIGYIKVNDAVTPNGDGINDFLMIEGIRQFPDNQLYISNASGKIVFEARGYNNTGNVFRGLDNKGNKLSKGVHYYVLIYQGTKQSGFFVLEY